MLSAEIEAKSGEVRLGALGCNHHIGERPSGKNGQVVAKGLDSVGILLSRLQHIQAFPTVHGSAKALKFGIAECTVVRSCILFVFGGCLPSCHHKGTGPRNSGSWANS